MPKKWCSLTLRLDEGAISCSTEPHLPRDLRSKTYDDQPLEIHTFHKAPVPLGLIRGLQDTRSHCWFVSREPATLRADARQRPSRAFREPQQCFPVPTREPDAARRGNQGFLSQRIGGRSKWWTQQSKPASRLRLLPSGTIPRIAARSSAQLANIGAPDG